MLPPKGSAYWGSCFSSGGKLDQVGTFRIPFEHMSVSLHIGAEHLREEAEFRLADLRVLAGNMCDGAIVLRDAERPRIER